MTARRRTRTICQKSFLMGMEELLAAFEHDKTCRRYRVLGFLDFVEGKSRSCFDAADRPDDYPFQTHFRDTLKELAEVLTEDEINHIFMEFRFARFGLPKAFNPNEIRRRV